MKMLRKGISVLLILTLILSMGITSFANFKDTNKHWANKEIQYLSEKKILNGYPDGTFKPQDNVKRAEIYKIINELMGYSQVSEVNFKDVKKDTWFYSHIGKGLKAGYITSKAGGNLQPNLPATREEVATIIGITFALPKDKSDSAKTFLDEKKISADSKGYISILKDNGYIAGYPDGNFKPEGLITRAEVSKMIKNICGEIINEPGVLSKNIEGNLFINTDQVILKDIVIKGDLYLSEGVGDGNLTLNNVTVKGQTRNLSKKGKIITDAIVVNSIKVISKDNAREINTVKGTLQMLANVEPTNATNKAVIWSVTNEDGTVTSKASINQEGLLTGVENGKVKVKATSLSNPTISDTIEIEIKGQLIPSTIIFTEEGPLAKTLKDKPFTNKVIGGEGEGEITYTSETPAVATVNKTTGEVTVLAVGTTVIKVIKAATKTHGEVISTYTVNVKKDAIMPITGVSIIGKESVGSELTAEITPKDATATYQWKRMYNSPTTLEDIPGATTNKYTPSKKDARWTIVVYVVATGEYSGSKTTTTNKISETPLLDPILNKVVTATNINTGQTLANSTLSGTFKNVSNQSLTGVLTWSDPTTIVNTTGDFRWIFKPDSNDYTWLRGNVSVKVNAAATNPDFSGGTGTLSDPYLVFSVQELDRVRNYLDKNFKQISNIEAQIRPIGDYKKPFSGTYDGNNKTIKVTMKYHDEDMIGLFGVTSTQAKLSNIRIVDPKINGKFHVGALAGNNHGSIFNCNVCIYDWETKLYYGIVGTQAVGGLVGYNTGIIDQCSISGSVIVGGNQDVGGLVGLNSDGIITNSYSLTDVYGVENIGGLVGNNENVCFIQNCYTDNIHVEGKKNIGGLVGLNGSNSGTIVDSYVNVGSIRPVDPGYGVEYIPGKEYIEKEEYENAGGLVGYNNGKIIRSYSSYANVTNTLSNYIPRIYGGNFEAAINFGGLVGYNKYEIKDSHASHARIYAGYPARYIGGREGVEPTGENAGGLVGLNDGTIDSSYAIGRKIKNSDGTYFNILANKSVGGLVGFDKGTINNSYSAFIINGKENVGGLVGRKSGGNKVNQSYYDSKITEQKDKDKGSPKPTEEMTILSTFSGWDFSLVWTIKSSPASYPYLIWQGTMNIPTPK